MCSLAWWGFITFFYMEIQTEELTKVWSLKGNGLTRMVMNRQIDGSVVLWWSLGRVHLHGKETNWPKCGLKGEWSLTKVFFDEGSWWIDPSVLLEEWSLSLGMVHVHGKQKNWPKCGLKEDRMISRESDLWWGSLSMENRWIDQSVVLTHWDRIGSYESIPSNKA